MAAGIGTDIIGAQVLAEAGDKQQGGKHQRSAFAASDRGSHGITSFGLAPQDPAQGRCAMKRPSPG